MACVKDLGERCFRPGFETVTNFLFDLSAEMVNRHRHPPTRRRLRFEPLERRWLLSASELCCASGAELPAASEPTVENRWHNYQMREDVDNDNYVSPADALLIIDQINDGGSRSLDVPSGEDPPSETPYIDVSDDHYVSPLDVLLVINELNAEAEAPGDPVLTAAEVTAFLKRAAAASTSEDAVIAIVDRGGRILGVRAEADVLSEYKVGTADERTKDFVFAVDGAVAKARTAAFFANGKAGVVGPLTSRTIRFVSQTTIAQREVESNPNIADLDSALRGPGFVAPIGLGGHFPPGVAHTPPVDLFAIEHSNRDSVKHAGLDAIIGTTDDIDLGTRFGADYLPGISISAPESYGVSSGRFPDARPRGIATLP